MFEVSGKYNRAKIFTDNASSGTVQQVIGLCNQESMKDSQIRIMPDCHEGAGCVIGTTMTLNDKVIPGLVGVDIGCGMLSLKIEEDYLDLQDLDEVVHEYVPSGFCIHDTAIASSHANQILAKVDVEKAMKSLGSLGGGNHFIEVNRDKDGNNWLVIHTGSRHLGIEVCEFYQNLGWEKMRYGGTLKDLSSDIIKEYKAAGRQKEISVALQRIKETFQKTNNAGKEFAFVEGTGFEDYLHDMKLAQEHAKINRQTIADQIISHARLHVVESFDTIHNYIDTENMILRKGSISAQKGEKVLIPMNMRDGSLVCIGKGNPDWNYSAPHGAGRLMSRSEAKAMVTMEEYQASMEGIYTTSVNQGTLDESPMAYKPMEEIIENIQDTVEVVDIVKPIYNFKAQEQEPPWRKQEYEMERD